MSNLQLVALAGGTGTRLWPLSRALYPKQFQPLWGTESCFQQSLRRAAGVCTAPPIVVCNEEHRFLAVEQCRTIDQAWDAIIVEPEARNTAPAIALAALFARAKNPDHEQLLLVLPSDHYIPDYEAFAEVIGSALPAANRGQLVTFGITPTAAHTGYGYIKKGAVLADGSYAVDKFEEKPPLERAETFFNSGEYLWNSGMFCFSANAYLEELQQFQPSIYDACLEAMERATTDLDFLRPGPAFQRSPAQSIDYAVMENTRHAAVVPTALEWSDLGSWDAMWAVRDSDANGNVHDGDIVALDSERCMVRGQDRLIATLGVKDLVIVDTPDALLVADKSQSSRVGEIVAELKRTGRSEPNSHTRVYRPWGSYESIDSGGRYQVKLITVNAGASLSLQRHYHRAEHWIVVSGTALVTCDDSEKLIYENESTYIPIGATHRLENPGKVPIELIEVQIGSYLGEDDIVRFDDNYGRAN